MKANYLFLFLILPALAFSQFQVQTIDVISNDLVYDSISDRIYISIPSANGANGNSLGIVNPNNYSLEKTVFMGSEPTKLAISDNGQFIYAGFSGTSTVRKFDVATQTAGQQFGLGSDQFSGPFYAEDIEVMPGHPNTIAVARRNIGISPKHEGVAIYDNGVQRSNSTPDHTGSNTIEFTAQNSLVGYNNETTEYGIRVMSIDNNGVSVTSVTRNVLSGFNQDFSLHNYRMYASNGTVVDVAYTPFVAGSFLDVTGPSVYDQALDLVCYASYDYQGVISFKRFSPFTFLLQDSMTIAAATGDVKNIITCGKGCYAFNTDSKLVIINDAGIGLSEPAATAELVVYPNPSAEYIRVSSAQEIAQLAIYDLKGQQVALVNQLNEKIALSHLPDGVYLLKATDAEGRVLHSKILKR